MGSAVRSWVVGGTVYGCTPGNMPTPAAGPGETIEHADVVVPAGQTGLEFSLA
jgi:hypothetical protein